MIKNIKRIIIFIPNIPFVIVIVSFVIYKVFKNNSIVELELSGDNLITNDIKEFVERIYPKHFRNFIAIMFYLYVFMNIF